MRGLLAVLAAAASLGLGGCGSRFDAARSMPDRGEVLVRCVAQALAKAKPQFVRAAMKRIEDCMAEQRLPGYALYDGRSRIVRYAYEDDQPLLRF